MKCYYTVSEGGEGEIIEKKSRFIARVYPVSNEKEALSCVEAIRKQYWDARHHCWAYVTGKDPAQERMSDDGEPSGTAGKPILDVIRARELTDVLIVVTRYFGGTLLGTGGLVRAYTGAAVEGLRHSTIVAKILGYKTRITAEYTDLGKIRYIMAQRGFHVFDTVYTEKVTVFVFVPMDEGARFTKEITEGTNGRAEVEMIDQCWSSEPVQGEE